MRRIALANKQGYKKAVSQRDEAIRKADEAIHNLEAAESRIALLESELREADTEKQQLEARVAVRDSSIEELTIALEASRGRYEVELANQERAKAIAKYVSERSTETG